MKSLALLILPLIAFNSYILGRQIPSEDWLTSNFISLEAGYSAIILMGFMIILATRWKWIEKICGGLDKMYHLHKWSGISVMLLALLHISFMSYKGTWGATKIIPVEYSYVKLFENILFIGLILTVFFAVVKKVPYHVWRIAHKLAGIVFMAAIMHWLTISSVATLHTPAGLWMGIVGIVGTFAFIYRLAFYSWLAPHYSYQVSEVNKDARTISFTIKPLAKKISYKAGNFVFISFKDKGLREPHPFTIAEAPNEDGNLRFVIRICGDYTRKLAEELKAGMNLEVVGPYGKFNRQKTSSPEVWIAGGVGITPFLSWLKDAETSNPNTSFFYLYHGDEQIPDVSEIEALAKAKNLNFIPLASTKGEALTTDLLQETLGDKVSSAEVYFCGPKGLLKYTKQILKSLSVPSSKLHYEMFAFR